MQTAKRSHGIAAVRGGLLSLKEACSRYTLTVNEFLSWQRSIDQHGLAGLRSTRPSNIGKNKAWATAAPGQLRAALRSGLPPYSLATPPRPALARPYL